MTTATIALVCEDEGHFVAATTLVDAVLLERHGWLDGILDDCRKWRGLNPDTKWYKFDPKDAHDLRPFFINGLQIKPSGYIGDKPLEPEAGMWRRILILFAQAKPCPDVVVLFRDQDGYPRRLNGLRQVRENLPWPFKVVAAIAQPEVEAWHVAGFDPEGDDERASHARVQSKLSFNPVLQSHRLTSHPNDAPTDAKQILAELCPEPQRRAACLGNRDRLRTNGEHNGVRAFLDEVDALIVPLFGAR